MKNPTPWVRVEDACGGIALFALVLIAVTVVYAFREKPHPPVHPQEQVARQRLRYTFWALAIFWIGFGAMAQPSITQVLTWFHSLLFQWTWSLFLSDPFIFLFWIFIIVTVFLFGRGLFCGWMCPFGSLQEAIYKVARMIGLKRFQTQLPQKWHDRLKWVKYAVFFGLLVVSMFSMGLAEKLAEVEPFKTTFLVGVMNRAWPTACLWRPSWACRSSSSGLIANYICPLGVARHAHVPLVWPQAQAGLQQLQGLRRGLWRPGH